MNRIRLRKYTPNEEIQDIEVQEKDYEADSEAISDADTLDDHIPENAQRAITEEIPQKELTHETEIQEEEKNHVILLSDSEDEIEPPQQTTTAKVQTQQKQIIVSGNYQTTNCTQPTVTSPTTASEPRTSQSIPPQRNI